MALVEEYRNIAKLAQDKDNAEVVIDAILTHFDVDYDDMDLGIEWLYTTGVIDYKFRSVLYKGEDWFKAKVGVTDEEIAAAEAKEKQYIDGCLLMAEKDLGLGHVVSGTTYLELAAAKGSAEAAAKLKDLQYAKNQCMLGEQYLAMGHKICAKTYFELAAAKGCPKAAAKLAEF